MKKQKNDELQQYLESQTPDMRFKMELIIDYLKSVPSDQLDCAMDKLGKSIKASIKLKGTSLKMEVSMENLLPKDGEVYMLPQFFSNEESDRLYKSLQTNIAWKQEPIKMFGKEIMQPRLTAWYGDERMSYTYSGITMQPLSWNDDLTFIKNKIEVETGYAFNSALLNFYRDGNDSVGWHRDNEKSLGINPIIASVSFGTSRDFHLKHVTDRDLTVKVPLTNGSLLLMKGKTQHHWLHSIQKEPKVRSGRINITFRTIVK